MWEDHSDGHRCIKAEISKQKNAGDFELLLSYNILNESRAEFVVHVWTGTFDSSPHIQRLDMLKRLGFKQTTVCPHTNYECHYQVLGTVSRDRRGMDKMHENQIYHQAFDKLADNLQQIFEMMRKLDESIHNAGIVLPYDDLSLRQIVLSQLPNEKVFDKGQQYDIYKDLKAIIQQAKHEVLIVDGYADESLFELYIDQVPKGVSVKLLTGNTPPGKLLSVAKLFKSDPGRGIEIRGNKVHDRLIFVDDQVWVLGQSIKDAGNKPTYLFKMTDKDLQYAIYIELFNKGLVLL